MAPILYYVDLSPPVRSVLLTAHAIGLELQLKNVSLIEGEHMKPEYLKLNPQHTVPTLDDDGFIIWDSHAINAYIVGKYAKDDSLYPKDLKKRAVVDQRLHFDSGILFPRLRNIFTGTGQWAACIQFPIIFLGSKEISVENQEALIQGYEFTNAFLENTDYLAGNSLTIADFSAIATLSSIVPVVPFDSEKYPNLSRWINKMKSLPYYQETNGIGADGVSSMVNQNLGR